MKGVVCFDPTFEFALFLIVGCKQSKLRYQRPLSNFTFIGKIPTFAN